MRIGILGGTGPAGTRARRPAGVGRLRRRDRLALEVPGDGGARQPGREVARPGELRSTTATTPAPPMRRRGDRHAVGLGGHHGPGARAERSAGKVVISMANALVRVGHEFQPLVPPRGSVAAHVQAAVPQLPGRGRVPPPAGQGARPPRRADRLRRADLLRRRRRRARRCQRDRRRASPAAARSTPASCPTPRPSRRSPPCCCSSTCATRPGWRPKLTGIKRDPRASRRDRCACTTPPARPSCRSSPAEQVLMYTCGITPYDATHLGHAATFLAYDVLQRRLIDLGHTVKCVRNVTDVDDPLFAKARELGVHYLDLAAGEEARFERDMEALNALPVLQHAAGLVGHPRHPRLHRHGARPRLRLRGRRPRVLRRVASSRRSARSATTRRGQMLDVRPRARRQRRRPEQAPPARLRAVAPVGARRAERGTPCGARAGRAGTSSARRWRCASWAPPSTCTAAAAT